MKIVCIIKTPSGGSWFVKQVLAMKGRGHDVVVLNPDPEGPLGQALVKAGATVRRAPVGLGPRSVVSLPANLRSVRRIISQEQADVVFYQLWASAVYARLSTIGEHVPKVH